MKRKIAGLLIFCVFILYPFSISQPKSENSFTLLWQQPKELINSDREDGLSRILKLENGEIWMVWMSNRDGNNEIYLKKQLRNDKWTDTINLTNNPSDDRMPFLFQDNSGHVWLLWTTDRKGNFDIYYQIYSNGKWSTPKPLSFSGHWDEYATGCLTKSGTIWIAWNSYQQENDDIYYSYKDGKSWGGPVRVTKDKAEDRFPFVFQSNDGKIWIFWSSDRDGNWEIYFKRYSPPRSLETKEPVRFTFDTSIDSTPYVIQTEDNRLWVFWTSDKGGGSIYYRYSDNGEVWSDPEKLESLRGYIIPSAIETEDHGILVTATKKSGNHYSIYTICSEFGEEKATLSIESSPSSSVYINDSYKGETPLDLKLEKGEYIVRIEKENYEIYTKTVTLSSGESESVFVELTKITPPPTTLSPTTVPRHTTSPPTTKLPTTSLTTTAPPTTSLYTPPSSQSSSFVYIGVFAGIIILLLVIYQMTRKKPEKIEEKEIEKEEPKKEVIIEKPSEHCPFCGKLIPEDSKVCPYCKKDLEITPELKSLLDEEKKWKEELERLKTNKSKLEEKIYEEKYNEIMGKLVDIKDKIIKEKMKGGKKK